MRSGTFHHFLAWFRHTDCFAEMNCHILASYSGNMGNLYKTLKSHEKIKFWVASCFSPGIILPFFIYIFFMILMWIEDVEPGFRILVGIAGIFIILFYSYLFQRLIPRVLRKKKSFLSYLSYAIFIVVIISIPLALTLLFFTGNEDLSFSIALANLILQVFVTVPFAWLIFKRYRKGQDEFITLQKDLGHSTASLESLRSQINPHFLFNVLNTLYGTALQENAKRTSEGIQQLGDMMRFMLRENVQEKIFLVREVEYLNNYITLQRLRTDINPGIIIRIDIEPECRDLTIAPMLLIPFVENAFKHGIRLTENSEISVSLTIKGSQVTFIVCNTIHRDNVHDPEKYNGGFGLKNVKERLQFIYPGKHILNIDQTDNIYSVHLTLELL